MRLPAHREDPSVPYVAGSLVARVFAAGISGGVAFPTLPRLGPVLAISPLVVVAVVLVARTLVGASTEPSAAPAD